MAKGLLKYIARFAGGRLTNEIAIPSSQWETRLARIIYEAGIRPIPHGFRKSYGIYRRVQIRDVDQVACEMGMNRSDADSLHDQIPAYPVSAKEAANWFAM